MKPHRFLSNFLTRFLSSVLSCFFARFLPNIRPRLFPLFAPLLLSLLTLQPAQAQSDPPGRVGRISLTSGQVDFRDFANDWSRPALVNWPVTSRNQITTGRGARTEIRVGSTAIRVDADSVLDVVELLVLDDVLVELDDFAQ